MGELIGAQALDESRAYTLTLSGGNDTSLLGHFTGSEVLTARLWPGATYPTSATLVAAWDPDLTGNPASVANPLVRLTVSTATIASLTPGTYQVEVIADAGTVDECLFRGSIRLDPTTGTTPLPRTYCSYQDLVDECSWLGQVEALEGSRAAQFLPERAQAAQWLEEQAMSRWRRDSASQALRHGPVLAVDPIIPTTGIDAGPFWGQSSIEDTTFRDAETAFSALLTSVGLMVDHDADRGTQRRIATLHTLYLALDDQIGNVQGTDTPYQTMAMRYRTKAMTLCYAWDGRVDADADGVADYRLRP